MWRVKKPWKDFFSSLLDQFALLRSLRFISLSLSQGVGEKNQRWPVPSTRYSIRRGEVMLLSLGVAGHHLEASK
jgi:hypothetical protein